MSADAARPNSSADAARSDSSADAARPNSSADAARPNSSADAARPNSSAARPQSEAARKPDWLRVAIPSGGNVRRVSETLAARGLHTVCEGARCPNKAECWGMATATFMVMGAACTRGCRFCAVDHRREGEALRPEEPADLALAVAELGLRYAVVTSVDRDDLPDRGAAHFAACARALKALRRPSGEPIRVELLVPDYREGEIELVLAAGPDVLAHNIETVRRLQGLRDPRASYEASLHTLELAARWASSAAGPPGAAGRRVPVVKSSIMLGLGEEDAELFRAMDDLRAAGCESLVLGQYLRPTAAQVEVSRYVAPDEFARYAEEARSRGFSSVVSAPLARTSYHARSSFEGGR